LLPDFQGVIETDDGAEVLFDYEGYGLKYGRYREGAFLLRLTHNGLAECNRVPVGS
jgi:hypothetical protein